jgi:hypothetical protein
MLDIKVRVTSRSKREKRREDAGVGVEWIYEWKR